MPEQDAIDPMQYISGTLLGEWLAEFEANNREYGDMHTELGVRAQYVDMHRKMGKLRKALWDGEDTSAWRENPREIVMDLIGHCFLMVERMDYDNVYPIAPRGRDVVTAASDRAYPRGISKKVAPQRAALGEVSSPENKLPPRASIRRPMLNPPGTSIRPFDDGGVYEPGYSARPATTEPVENTEGNWHEGASEQ